MRALTLGAVLLFGLAGDAAAQMPVRVGGAIKPPARIRDVRPVYPSIAQSARVSGVVIAEITVDPQGNVSDVRLLRGVPLLNDAAIDAVRQWQYAPTVLNGVAVPVIMTVTVNFSLMNDMPIGGGPEPYPPPEPPPPPADSGPLPLPTAPASEAFVLSPGHAGVVAIGMTADEVYGRVPRSQVRLVDLYLDRRFSPALEVSVQPGERPSLIGLVAGPEWRIAQIEVVDPRFRTQEGLGVGSTLGDLRARDAGLTLERSRYGIAASLGGRRLMFVFDPRTATTDPTQLPDTSRVYRVFVTDGSPLPQVPRPAAGRD